MPIFEYRCESCGNEFELLVFGDGKDVVCPSCGKGKVVKKFSVFGVHGVSSGQGGSPCGGCTSTACSTCGVK